MLPSPHHQEIPCFGSSGPGKGTKTKYVLPVPSQVFTLFLPGSSPLTHPSPNSSSPFRSQLGNWPCGSQSLPLDPQCTLHFPIVEFITLAFQMSTSSPQDCKLNRVGDQACVLHQQLSGPSTEPDIQSEVGGRGEKREKRERERHQLRSTSKGGQISKEGEAEKEIHD